MIEEGWGLGFGVLGLSVWGSWFREEGWGSVQDFAQEA